MGTNTFNPYAIFRQIFPTADYLIVEVTAVLGDGRYEVQNPEGDVFIVEGPDGYIVTDKVSISLGNIVGSAPTLVSQDRPIP